MNNLVDYEINKELGECYLFMGDFEKAASYYEKAIACAAEQAAPYMGIAAIAMQDNRLNDAKAAYSKALKCEESDKAYAGLAMAEQMLGNEEAAFENLGKALDINCANMIAMNLLVQLAYKLKRIEDILPYLHNALEANDTEAVRFTLAGCLSFLGREKEAKEQLEILLGKNPANAEAQELYAHIAA